MLNSFINIFKKEYYSLTILSISLLISTILIKSVVLPIWVKNIGINKQIKEYSILVDDSKNNTILKKEILKKQKLLEEKHTNLSSGMADASDLSALLQLIFDKAWKNNIRFDKTTPQEMVTTKTSINYPVLLELTTEYNKLGTFISSLEAMPQIMRVERVAVTAKGSNKVSAIMMVTCFLSKDSIGGSNVK